MELNELKELEKFGELDLIYKIIEIADDSLRDAEKVIKNEKAAKIRLRKKMQDINFISSIVRNKAQGRIGILKKDKLKIAIEKEIEKREKDKKRFEGKMKNLIQFKDKNN